MHTSTIKNTRTFTYTPTHTLLHNIIYACTYTKHMYTLVHERIYMRDRDIDRESLSTYETASCKILDVNKYRAHLETSLKTSVVTIATIVQGF